MTANGATAPWGLLTNHARALILIARDPNATLLRTIAKELDVTEGTAHRIVADLVRDGYLLCLKDGRRNRYEVLTHLPLPDPLGEVPTIGELLDLVAGVAKRSSATEASR